jgi:hypothetical protein
MRWRKRYGVATFEFKTSKTNLRFIGFRITSFSWASLQPDFGSSEAGDRLPCVD